MGGKAPYGYILEISGEISKHGRALHHLVIVEEEAEIVRYIYELAANKEFGSQKIAQILNADIKYQNKMKGEKWKTGTITSILTNPVYAGYTAYKRREKLNGRYRRLDRAEWILAEKPNQEIIIVDQELWTRVQEQREKRRGKYQKCEENKDAKVITRNDGMLALIDVLYCGYCGEKMTNGTKYNYWTMKETGERRASRVPAYKCQGIWQGIPHEKQSKLQANKIEPIVFEAIAEYIGKLQEQEDAFVQIRDSQNQERKRKREELNREKKAMEGLERKIAIMEEKIPNAITGEYPLSLDELVNLIKKEKEKKEQQDREIQQKEKEVEDMMVFMQDWEELRQKIPTWQEIFLHAKTPVKRALVNKLIERIDVKDTEIHIRFKIHPGE